MADKWIYAIRLKNPLPCGQKVEDKKISLVYGDWLLYCDYHVPYTTTKGNSAIHFDSYESAQECLERNDLEGEIWRRARNTTQEEDWHQYPTSLISQTTCSRIDNE